MTTVSADNHSPADIFRRLVLCGLMCLLSLSGLGPARANDNDTAQYLLFDQPYLANLSPPAKLRYRFEHSTSDESKYGEVFEDDVIVDIGPPGEGNKFNQVMLDTFARTRARKMGPFFNVKGNPVILMFLERDMYEMKKIVKGSPVFFRNTMRRAMRGGERVEDTTITYDGKELPAKTIAVTPYDNDKIPPQYREFQNKTYTFTVSDAVPGGIYEITSSLADREDKNKMLVSDRLVFEGKGGE